MMMARLLTAPKHALALLAAIAGLGLAAPAVGQPMQAVDPDAAIDADLAGPPAVAAQPPEGVQPLPPVTQPAPVQSADPATAPAPVDVPVAPAPAPAPADAPPAQATAAATANGSTYREDDLIGAAEGVFGKGAAGLADVIKDILAKQGQPNAYIVGREASAALVVGLRYGSGTLHHKVEGEKPVYWTGPSLGFDAGANGGSAFVLVYNLYDTADLYKRFAAGEGQAYLVGGFHVSYLRRGDVVLIPVRAGVGVRLGVNAGYMKLSSEPRWFPF